jgi:hypothetical protein
MAASVVVCGNAPSREQIPLLGVRAIFEPRSSFLTAALHFVAERPIQLSRQHVGFDGPNLKTIQKIFKICPKNARPG